MMKRQELALFGCGSVYTDAFLKIASNTTRLRLVGQGKRRHPGPFWSVCVGGLGLLPDRDARLRAIRTENQFQL